MIDRKSTAAWEREVVCMMPKTWIFHVLLCFWPEIKMNIRLSWETSKQQ